MTSYKDYLQAAAKAVEEQVAENPALGVPVDPDVAEYMGAFEDLAMEEMKEDE